MNYDDELERAIQELVPDNGTTGHHFLYDAAPSEVSSWASRRPARR